jgi:LysR family nitrogen assimilation transcriptional regulator
MTTERTKHWDLARLQLFVAVGREGSLTRAAAALGTPQPAISRQIAKLEQECGGRLFLRTGRGVSLSPLGERVLPRVEAILQSAQELRTELDAGVDAPSGEVRIGALPSLYLSVIVPLFQLLRRRMPGIHLQVFEGSAGQIDQWLATGFVDIGLPYRYGHNMTDVELLIKVTSYLVGPPGDSLTSGKTVKFAQLDGVPLVLPGSPSGVRLLYAQLARKAGIQLNVVLDADSTQIQKATAAGAGAYAILPMHAVSAEVEAGTLQAARIVEPRIDRAIVMGLTSARPATQAIREVAKQTRRLMQGRAASLRDLT